MKRIRNLRVHPYITNKCCRLSLPCTADSMYDTFTCPKCGSTFVLVKTYDKFWVRSNSMMARGIKL